MPSKPWFTYIWFQFRVQIIIIFFSCNQYRYYIMNFNSFFIIHIGGINIAIEIILIPHKSRCQVLILIRMLFSSFFISIPNIRVMIHRRIFITLMLYSEYQLNFNNLCFLFVERNNLCFYKIIMI